jgi:hypothetical protein
MFNYSRQTVSTSVVKFQILNVGLSFTLKCNFKINYYYCSYIDIWNWQYLNKIEIKNALYGFPVSTKII